MRSLSVSVCKRLAENDAYLLLHGSGLGVSSLLGSFIVHRPFNGEAIVVGEALVLHDSWGKCERGY